MNIALIGAPGSGKTSLAYRLARELEVYDPTCKCGDRTVKIIDLYVGDIEERTKLALGPASDHIGNLYVALERYARERVARFDHNIVISCGTMIETAVYLALYYVSLTHTLPPEAQLELAPSMDAVLRMFAVLYTDIFAYDHVFYLPPVRVDNDDIEYIDRQLQAGLEGFKLATVTMLMEPERQLEDALLALGEVKDEVPALGE